MSARHRSIRPTGQMPRSVAGDSVASKFVQKSPGTQGTHAKVVSNFFEITVEKSSPDFFQYNVEIIPKHLANPDDLAAAEKPNQTANPRPAPSVDQPAPAKQSGKPKGSGRRAAAAKRAGIDLTAKSSPAIASSRPAAKVSANGPTAKENGSTNKENSPPANCPATNASTPETIANDLKACSIQAKPNEASGFKARSKRLPKERLNDIFDAVFSRFRVFQCNVEPFTDVEKNIYSTTKFHLTNNRWSGLVPIKNGDAEEEYLVKITVPETSHCQNFLALRVNDGRITPYELQSLDILLRNGLRLSMVLDGPNLYPKYNDPRAVQYEIGKGDPLKYIQPGHYQSARKASGGLFCNVDRTMAVFTKGNDLIGIIDKLVPGASKTMRELRPSDQEKISGAIKGFRFTVKHLKYHRTFTASGLGSYSVKNHAIEIEEDGVKVQTTVYEYFKKKYPEFLKRTPVNQFLPCVKYGSKKEPSYCPIECVQLISEVYPQQKLKPDQQGDVTRISSKQKPFERIANIKKHVRVIQDQHGDYLGMFGVKIKDEPTIVDARILDAPKLAYAKGAVVASRNGQWEMRTNDRKLCEFYKPSSESIGSNWAVINFNTVRGQPNPSPIKEVKLDNFIEDLVDEARHKGMQLSKPETVIYKFDYRGKGTLQADLFDLLDERGVRFALFLFPKDDQIFSEIKTLAELKQFGRGLATQCLCQEKAYWNPNRLSTQFLTNILLKINPKLRGTNVSIGTQGRPAIMKDKKTMFMGLDVTHPGPGSGLRYSIAAVVATYTDDFDKVFAKTRVQERGRKELINLQKIMGELLAEYRKVNNCYPDKVVVYRDGVGEGDFEKMIERELGDLRKANQELKAGIKFTYIMVQKRHNVRLMPAGVKADDLHQNVKPGTCVDQQITHSEFFEFYLCSHAGALGTSKSTKYVMLVDENDLTADEIQKATYWLCHLFPRCTKTASIVPIVSYAHLLAERTRSYLAYFDNSDGRSTVGSGRNEVEVLSEAQRLELDANITVHDNLKGTLHFI